MLYIVELDDTYLYDNTYMLTFCLWCLLQAMHLIQCDAIIMQSDYSKIIMINTYSFPMRGTQIARFMGPTWGPPGSCRPQMVPMLAPWTLLSGKVRDVCCEYKVWFMFCLGYCSAVCNVMLYWTIRIQNDIQRIPLFHGQTLNNVMISLIYTSIFL